MMESSSVTYSIISYNCTSTVHLSKIDCIRVRRSTNKHIKLLILIAKYVAFSQPLEMYTTRYT